LTVLRRLLLLLALMFWQGGFMFYGAVVVPVGAEVLGSHREQGRVTRAVTHYLNAAGVVALALWAWDLAAGGGGRLRWAVWGALAATLGLLAWLHLRLDALLDPGTAAVLDAAPFQPWHRCYLLVSTAQWALSVLLAALTVRAWWKADGRRTA
jgi:hypothetical protein